MAESNDLELGGRKRLHIGTDGDAPTYCIWPAFQLVQGA